MARVSSLAQDADWYPAWLVRGLLWTGFSRVRGRLLVVLWKTSVGVWQIKVLMREKRFCLFCARMDGIFITHLSRSVEFGGPVGWCVETYYTYLNDVCVRIEIISHLPVPRIPFID